MKPGGKSILLASICLLLLQDRIWAAETLSPNIRISDVALRESVLDMTGRAEAGKVTDSSELKNTENAADIENIPGLLRDMGFHYADKFQSDFKVKIKDQYGEAQALLVTADKENAFLFREIVEFNYGKGTTVRRINLIELNPFTPRTGFQHLSGFCRFHIHESNNTASLGVNQEVIVRTNIYHNKGLGSVMLSLAIEKAKTLGMRRITVYNVTGQAFTLYQKLGFESLDEKTMEIDLTKHAGSWRLKDVARDRMVSVIDLRNTADLAASKIDIKAIKDSILYNNLIQEFFRLSAEDTNRKIPWSYIAYEILEFYPDLTDKLIKQVESKGEDWIVKQGEIIRETHSSRSSYKSTDTGGSWTAFIKKTTDSEIYNLMHLLAHSIGYVQNYLDIDEKEKAEKFFTTGYIILRAIEIESRKNDLMNSAKNITDVTLKKTAESLPEVKLNRLKTDQAFIMVDRLDAAYEKADIHLLGDAKDTNPEHAYSVNVADGLNVVFLAQDQETVYKLADVPFAGVPAPDTYYIAVSDGETVIGYGAVAKGVMGEEEDIFISFRIFKPYRHQSGKRSEQIFKSVLSGAREIFGREITKFIVPVHQISGKRGIDSGAAVFYLKMGFKCDKKQTQELWENKYSARVAAGEKLEEHEIKEISQNRLILDLNGLRGQRDLTAPDISISPNSIEQNITLNSI